MLLILFCTAVFFGTIQGFSQENANQYIDMVLGDQFAVEADYSRLDPYKLDNIEFLVNFTGKPRGSAVLSKGRLLNLSNVRRARDCTVPLWVYNNVTFTCSLQFDALKINYTANITFENMNVVFYPTVDIKGTNFTVEITSNAEENVPNLRSFIVNNVGAMTVKGEMINIANIAKVIKPAVAEALLSKSNQSVYKALNGRFKSALAYSIYRSPLTFDG